VRHDSRAVGALARWLATATVLAVIGVALLDTGALVVNAIQLDETAADAASQGRAVWQQTRSRAAMKRSITLQAQTLAGAVVEEVVVDDSGLGVTLHRQASVRLLDEVGPLRHLVTSVATHHLPLQR
jgi:nitrous oxidase accessory protein NosD